LFIENMDNKIEISPLAKIIEESGLEKSKAQVMLDNFSNFFKLAAEWEQKAKNLNVTSADQVTEMKMAREARLFLKQKRVEVEHTRVALKEQSTREGKAIEGIANILKALIIPIEEHLDRQEHFIEIQEANRKSARKEDRLKQLAVYAHTGEGLDLLEMADESFNAIIVGLESKTQASIRIEKERIAKEEADAKERERIRLENIRLQKEAETKEKELEAERKSAEEARLKHEKEQKEQAEKAQKELDEQKRIAEEARKLQEEKSSKEKADLEHKLAVEKVRKDLELQKQRAEQQVKEEEARKEHDRLIDEMRANSIVVSVETTGVFWAKHNSGVSGAGKTAEEAITNFCNQWLTADRKEVV